MSEKHHQTNKSEYQIRVDGVAVYWPHMMDQEAMDTWAEVCQQNPGCYVDIVKVNTEILFSQFEYNQMKKHFS